MTFASDPIYIYGQEVPRILCPNPKLLSICSSRPKPLGQRFWAKILKIQIISPSRSKPLGLFQTLFKAQRSQGFRPNPQNPDYFHSHGQNPWEFRTLYVGPRGHKGHCHNSQNPEFLALSGLNPWDLRTLYIGPLGLKDFRRLFRKYR